VSLNLRALSALLAAGAVALLLAGCGGEPTTAARQPARPQAEAVSHLTRRPSAAEQLPALARGLVPPAARESVKNSDLEVKDCGISPTYPCIHTFFTLGGSANERKRMAMLRGQARASGWRIVRSKPFGTGVSLELSRGSFHARYAMERGLGPGSGIIGLELYGPANVLARPSSAERSRWSNEKRRYVARANAICASTLRRMKKIADVEPAITRAARELHGLRAPSGDEQRVNALLRPLDTLVQAVRSLDSAKGEDALGPAVAFGTYATRFERAAARYGLTGCRFH
jgi:hypothetical protein